MSRGVHHAPQVAEVPTVENVEILGLQERLHNFVDVHRVHGRLRHPQRLQPLILGVSLRLEPVQPGEALPAILVCLLGKLLDHTSDVSRDPHADSTVSAYLREGGVHLDDVGIGTDGGRAGESDAVVLLPSEQHHNVGLGDEVSCPV